MNTHHEQDILKRNAELEKELALKNRGLEIEAALERVRSRTNAMHRSDNLHDVIIEVNDQLRKLGFRFDGTDFLTDYSDKGYNIWIANFPTPIYVPAIDHKLFDLLKEVIKRGDDFFTFTLTTEEKNIHFKNIFENTIAKNSPEELKQYVYNAKGMASSCVVLENIILSVTNFASIPYTDAENGILKRFANVFEQSYTRFLDLQKAEAQAREAQIELGLERVRARAMAMQKSDELSELVDTVFKELTKLDFALTWCIINIIDEPSLSNTVWAANPDITKAPESYHMLFEDYPFHHAMMKGWKERHTRSVYTLEGDEKRIYDDYLFSETEFKRTPEAAQASSKAMEKYVVSFSFSNFGGLQTVGDVPLSDANLDILSRFGKVFDLTYTRFNDLKQAEAQARESQIQLALERVRARTMAMQHSDELKDAAALLFQQVKSLGVPAYSCGYNIWEKDEKTFTSWMSTQDGSDFNAVQNIPLTEDANFIRFAESREKGEQFFVLELRGKRMQEHYEYLKTIPAFKAYFDYAISVGFDLPETQIHHLANFSQGNLLFITLESCSEFHDVFKRFAAVFEQTYTRFLDLQKAEAQARESQIQLALERVRARTMAMQKSDELPEAANLLFQQVQSLGMPAWSAGYCIWDDDKQAITLSMSSEGVLQPMLRMPLTEDPSLKHFREAYERGESFFVEEVCEDALKQHYAYLRTLPGVKETLDDIERAGFPVPTFQIFHLAYFTQGFLLFITYEQVPESHDIFKRFAKVFEQTYTRFLDLQKVEAQARESQIQLALERVRARTMAMQKSDELPETSLLLFQQVKELGETTVQNSIGIVNEEAGFVELSTTVRGHHMPHTLNVPIDDPYVMAKAVAAWKANRKSLKLEFVGQELKTYNEHRNSFFETKINFPEDQWIVNIIFFSKGWLSFSCDKNISDETFDLLKRLAAVFEQTYIRFNDLNQAEEQARESQIQLALERVRARTMAMQKSDELMETAVVLFDQLNQLGEHIERTIIGIMNEEESVIDIWATRPDGSQMDKMQKFPIDEPIVMQQVYGAWRQQKKSIVIDLQGEELEGYFQFLKSRSTKMKRENFGERRVENFAFFSKGMLGIISVDPNTPANVQLYERFAAVFDQTYTRFLDLQKAETQAREAKTEAALERVRSRSMAMHKSDDLHEVIKVVVEQLSVLSVKFNVSNFAKIDPDGSWDLWLSTPEQAYPALVHVPYIDHRIFSRITEEGKKGNDFFTDVYYREEANIFFHHFFENTIAKNTPEERKQFVYNSKGFARSIFLTKNIWFSVGRYDSISFSDEENAIFKRFANVFEQAYTRFLDLQKAEAQAREADIELSLERVRAKTMAMQKPSEFVDVINIIGEQFVQLGFDIEWVNFGANGFNISEGIDIWNFAVVQGASPISARVFIPYFDHPVFTTSAANINEFLNGGRDFIMVTLDKQTKDTWLDHLYTKTIFKEIPQELRKEQYDKPGYTTSNISLKDTWLSIGKFDIKTFTDEQHTILRRFANAFGQAYTRFLDLQKAEAQAREAQIEAGLERVRSRAMAMQTSEELNVLIGTVFTELTKLDLVLTRCVIWIFDKQTKAAKWWMANSEDASNPAGFYIKYHESHPYLSFLNEWEKQTVKWVYDLHGQIKKEWDDFLFSETELVNLPKFVQHGMRAPDRVLLSATFNNFGAINVASLEPLSDEHYDILLRFAKVFDLTYTRFNDLKQAEAQAREARIETALERVRARTMAMQKSDELPETTFLLFQQLKGLGETAAQLSIGIIKEEEGYVELSATVHGNQLLQTYHVPKDEPYVMKKAVKAWKEKQRSLTLQIEGQELKDYNIWRNRILEKKIDFPEDQWIVNLVFFSKGMLSFSSDRPIPKETLQLLERFAGVFDLTYTRFLDLKKAEAQTREAQIELALERVRARTMAMHRSEELAETAHVVFHQLSELGGIPDRIAIGIADEINSVVNFWSTDQQGSHLDHSFSARLNERTTIAKTYEAWKEQKKSLVIDLHGEELKEWIQFARGEMGISVKDDQIKDRRVHTLAFFSHGWILVTSHEPQSTETIQILERFASVFNLTYRRFLDLEKAEAQAREAQIEMALEKVRSRSLAMHKSDELQEVVNTVFERLQELNIEIASANIAIFKEGTRNYDLWIASPVQKRSASFHIPYRDLSLTRDVIAARESGKEFFTMAYSFEEKNEWFDFAFKETDFKFLDEARKQFILNAPGITIGIAFSKHTGVQINRYSDKLLSEGEADILKRFSKVFEQAYIRFRDLEKAEAQAREAQIEASLERVRSKTMAMHKSDELLDIIIVVSEQLQQLNIRFGNVSFGVNNQNYDLQLWMAVKGYPQAYHIHWTFLDNPGVTRLKEAQQQPEKVYSDVLTQAENNEWLQHIFNCNPALDIFSEEARNKLLNSPGFARSIAVMKDIFIVMGNYAAIPYTDDENAILKRFANVFEQAYKRFHDLQKAEAQAREAQIEASLERVRSKTMAMHNSQDVGETVATMFAEFVHLGIHTNRCGILIFEDQSIAEVWTARSNPEGKATLIIGRLNLNVHNLLTSVYEAWKRKESFHRYDLLSGDIASYYEAINRSQNYPVKFDVNALPQKEFHSDFFFPEGAVFAFTSEPVAEEHSKIFKRFAGVFGQTYRRYLDLQKAEAQAREALIEGGLERVRARTMAMHSSDDVGAATATMFTELEKLGIENFRGGITNIHSDRTQEVWSVNNLAEGKSVKAVGIFNMDAHPFWQRMYEEWVNKKDFVYTFLTGKDKDDYIKVLNATQGYLPQTIQEFPDVHFQVYAFNEGGVWTNSLKPHTEEDKQIMKRFASVFSLTFRRYQDLKKAEAQAREATIEAALEKVRGKAMAMHNSNDLSVTTSMIIGELRKLGITPIRCGVGIISKETHKAQLYTATASADGDSLSVVGWVLLKGHPVLENIYEKWVEGEDYFPELIGDSLRSYYEQLLAGLSVPLPDFKDGQKHYGHFFSFSVGCLYTWSDIRYNDDEIKILRRFATIIDLTFRRYFELQKSETNAREAVKQAALDRIRADIASMRTIKDLDRITPLIWNELTVLGIPFIRCGVFIMDDDQDLIHTFLSTPDGKAIAAFHLPYDTPGNISKVIDGWRHKKIYLDHWGQEEFVQFADILMKQGALSSREQYLKTIPYGGFYLHFLPFLQGMLYVGNTTQLGDEEIELIQHVADAFSTAYARYEDFNKLEAAKQTVERTLTDLKQTQQQLVQSEKMASLGELTAGIAHEIQNPLNFVNNFSEVSKELLDEMKTELEIGNTEDAKDIADDVIQNLEKINHHGKRADAIVKSMLQHSRSSSGKKEPADINGLADEYLRLAYHGLRAKDKSFNAKFETELDNSIGKINIISQDIGRVLVNLINNAFYAVSERKKQESNGYEPTVTVYTKKIDDKIEIKVKDNGNGISQKVLDKIFQPFFTTKPTGQGTGLGLSLAYDIITKGHGGELKVETKEGEGSEFIIQLPVN